MASLNNKKLENILTEFMQPHRVRDFTVNGMQVQGKDTVTKVITGVTASQALIDAAVEQQADAILVHHGYFWKNESPAITGIKYNRIKTLIKHDINLYAYHLPLDIHPELGNNVELAKLLGITVRRGLEPWDKASVALVGKFEDEISTEELTQRIETQLNRSPLVVDAGKPIKSVAWCTGGGQSYIELAIEQGIDAFISAVHPSSSCKLTSIPSQSNSRLTTSKYPSYDASISAVYPRPSCTLMLMSLQQHETSSTNPFFVFVLDR